MRRQSKATRFNIAKMRIISQTAQLIREKAPEREFSQKLESARNTAIALCVTRADIAEVFGISTACRELMWSLACVWKLRDPETGEESTDSCKLRPDLTGDDRIALYKRLEGRHEWPTGEEFTPWSKL